MFFSSHKKPLGPIWPIKGICTNRIQTTQYEKIASIILYPFFFYFATKLICFKHGMIFDFRKNRNGRQDDNSDLISWLSVPLFIFWSIASANISVAMECNILTTQSVWRVDSLYIYRARKPLKQLCSFPINQLCQCICSWNSSCIP